MIEKIMFDVDDPFNSSIVYDGFEDFVKKYMEAPTTTELKYNKILDDYLKTGKARMSSNLRNAMKNRTLVEEYMKNKNDFKQLPFVFQNAVVYVYSKIKNTRERKINKSSVFDIIDRNDAPIIANMKYSNYKHDPTPQVFLMGYERKYNLFNGINIKYLSIAQIKALIKFHFKYPKADMQFLYYSVLKPQCMHEVTGAKISTVREHVKRHEHMWINHSSTPMVYKAVNKIEANKPVRNILGAYRRYKYNYSSFYAVPVTLFDYPEEENI